MEFLGFQFSIEDYILIILLILFFSFQIYWYLRYFRGIIRHNKKETKGTIDFTTSLEPVSVVICARDEEQNLRQFLPLFLEQDYPEFEVIVVNDGSTDGTEDYLSLMRKSYPNLRTSFVPNGTANISTKKLAITIGIKAAKHELILLSDADCMPEGKDWIQKMARNFMPSVEFVLGYGGYLRKRGLLNKIIKFDTLFTAIQYLGMAQNRFPYMGVGRNLAYRKSTFFNKKGFAGLLHLQSGDDDLFVNHSATAENTRIEVDKSSTTWSEPKLTIKQWYVQKERHLSVSGNYKSTSKVKLLLEPFSRALFYATTIAIFVWGGINLNWLLIGLTALLFLIRYFIQLQTINKTAKILGERKFYFLILLLDIFLPLFTLYLLIFGKKNKKIRWK